MLKTTNSDERIVGMRTIHHLEQKYSLVKTFQVPSYHDCVIFTPWIVRIQRDSSLGQKFQIFEQNELHPNLRRYSTNNDFSKLCLWIGFVLFIYSYPRQNWGNAYNRVFPIRCELSILSQIEVKN